MQKIKPKPAKQPVPGRFRVYVSTWVIKDNTFQPHTGEAAGVQTQFEQLSQFAQLNPKETKLKAHCVDKINRYVFNQITLAHIYVATKERPELQYDHVRDANTDAKYNQYKDAWLYHGLLYSIYHEMKNVHEAKKEHDKTAASKEAFVKRYASVTIVNMRSKYSWRTQK
jgi:hypothetical protein